MPLFIIIGVGVAVAAFRKYFHKQDETENEAIDDKNDGNFGSTTSLDSVHSSTTDFELFELSDIDLDVDAQTFESPKKSRICDSPTKSALSSSSSTPSCKDSAVI